VKLDIAKQWTEALRSGKYRQTLNMLKNTFDEPSEDGTKVGYCCLGVLCELAADAGILNRAENDGYTYEDAEGTYYTALPPVVLEWAGIHFANGWRSVDEPSLVGLNDEWGFSFEQIAEVIEKDAEKL
jgi:hypothetical protein